MRRLISFAFATALLAGGLWVIASQFLGEEGPTQVLVMAGVTMTLLGGCWLWVDFLAPRLGFKGDE